MGNCGSCASVLASWSKDRNSREDFGQIVGMLLFPTFREDGLTRNYVDLSAPLTQTAYEGIIYNSDENQRFIYVSNIVGGKPEIPEPRYQDINGIRTILPSQDPIQVNLQVKSGSFSNVGRFRNSGCGDLSVIFIDVCGRWLGVDSGANGHLYGHRLTDNTLSALYAFADRDTIALSNILFDLDGNVDLESWLTVPCDYIEANVKDTLPLSDMTVRLVSSSGTDISVEAFTFKNAQFADTVDSATDLVVKDSLGADVTTTNTFVNEEKGIINFNGTFATGTYTVTGNLFTSGINVKPLTVTIS